MASETRQNVLSLEELEKQALLNAKYLINKSDFLSAYWSLANFAVEQGVEKSDWLSADFWFQLALTAGLVSRKHETSQGAVHEMIPFYIERMRQATGYNPVMWGDVLRDQALTSIRHGELEAAEQLLETLASSRAHENDVNRTALLQMAVGRLHYAHNNYDVAEDVLGSAYKQMFWNIKQLRNQDDQNDIGFHWIKAATMCGRPANIAYDEFMRTEASAKRRWAARIIHNFGRTGVWLIEQAGL